MATECPDCGATNTNVLGFACNNKRCPMSIHLGILDDADHEAKIDGDTEYRKSELRIQALGAAISRRDWPAAERAYEAIRDKFYSHSSHAPKRQALASAENFVLEKVELCARRTVTRLMIEDKGNLLRAYAIQTFAEEIGLMIAESRNANL